MRSPGSVLALACLFWLTAAAAQETVPGGARYLADIELQSSVELVQLLRRANQLLLDGAAVQDGGAQVTFVLHGPVIRDLVRRNYRANQELVNLAASLSALRVVKIEICRSWLGVNGIDESDLQPFVEPVDLAASEIERLRREQNYLDF